MYFVGSLDVRGVVEALLSVEEGGLLAALDLSFATGLAPAAVLELARSRASLMRCNLRGAKAMSCEVYNDVGALMHERNGLSASGGQHKTVHKRLHGDGAAFYYLKR